MIRCFYFQYYKIVCNLISWKQVIKVASVGVYTGFSCNEGPKGVVSFTTDDIFGI